MSFVDLYLQFSFYTTTTITILMITNPDSFCCYYVDVADKGYKC